MEATQTRMRSVFRLILAAAIASAAGLSAHSVHAAVHQAGLVIEHSSGRLIMQCVNFMQDQLSGFQLIQRSGVSYQAQSYGSMGEAICQLDGEPSPVPGNCLGTGPYWQYLHRVGTSWVQSQIGASGWMLHDGDMDGWRYTGGAAQTLPPVTLAQVCTAPVTRPAPTVGTPAAATPQPTPTPSASSLETAFPSVTAWLPTPTPTPKPRPSASTPAAAPLGVLGGSLLLLAALAAWNLWRRGP